MFTFTLNAFLRRYVFCDSRWHVDTRWHPLTLDQSINDIQMSLDRFLAVVYPLQTKHLRTPRAALCVTVVIWVLASVAAMPPGLVYTVWIYDRHGPDALAVCADDWGRGGGGSTRRATYYLVLFVITYAIPVGLIGTFSTLTVRRLWVMEGTEGQSQRR